MSEFKRLAIFIQLNKYIWWGLSEHYIPVRIHLCWCRININLFVYLSFFLLSYLLIINTMLTRFDKTLCRCELYYSAALYKSHLLYSRMGWNLYNRVGWNLYNRVGWNLYNRVGWNFFCEFKPGQRCSHLTSGKQHYFSMFSVLIFQALCFVTLKIVLWKIHRKFHMTKKIESCVLKKFCIPKIG